MTTIQITQHPSRITPNSIMSKQEKVFTTVLIYVGNEKNFAKSLLMLQLFKLGEEILLHLHVSKQYWKDVLKENLF